MSMSPFLCTLACPDHQAPVIRVKLEFPLIDQYA